MSAQWVVDILARYASRFSVRALDLTVDSSLVWMGAALALVAAAILAFVPRLPSAHPSNGLKLPGGGVRITGAARRRQRIFAVTQIASSFVLLAGAVTLITTLIALQRAPTGLDTRRVLVLNVPGMSNGKTDQQVVAFYKELMRRIDALPGVNRTAYGMLVPWRDSGLRLEMAVSAEGGASAAGDEDPRAQFRIISPGFFAALGVPIVAGRDFGDLDGQLDEPVAIVSETLARRVFPDQDALDRHIYTETRSSTTRYRIVGVVADIDDEHVVPEPTLTIYSTFERGVFSGGRLFIHTGVDPYSLVAPVTRIIRSMSADQPIERAATLEDVRAEALMPDRLNSLVFGLFAAVALAIAVIGVAGVLGFSVSARTRELGIRLALGCQPQRLLRSVVADGAVMAAIGVLTGAALGAGLLRLADSYFPGVKAPGAWPVVVSALVLVTAAVVASLLPAARAARVDVNQVLRSE